MPFDIQNAAAFIPQRAPFVLVENLLHSDEKISVCNFNIPEKHFFVHGGLFSTSGMVESMAQTAAAGTGYQSSQLNLPVPVGYIGSVQQLSVVDWPKANSEIILEIKLVTRILHVSVVSGTVTCNGKQMASCEMKIFINPS